MSTITTTVRDVSLLKHRDTVLTPADQDEFVSKFEITMDELSEQLVVDINDVSDEMNIVAGEVNTNASASATSATLSQDYANEDEDVEVEAGLYSSKHFSLKAAESASTAEATANNKGAWSALTGALNIPASVNHDGDVWALNVNLADVTASEPAPANSDWTSVGTLSNVVEDLTPQLGGDLDSNGKTFNNSSYTQIADASLGTGTHTFAKASGDFQQLTATGNITLAVSGFVSGKYDIFEFELVNGGDYTITFNASWKFDSGTAPTLTSGGTDVLQISKNSSDVYTVIVKALAVSTVA